MTIEQNLNTIADAQVAIGNYLSRIALALEFLTSKDRSASDSYVSKRLANLGLGGSSNDLKVVVHDPVVVATAEVKRGRGRPPKMTTGSTTAGAGLVIETVSTPVAQPVVEESVADFLSEGVAEPTKATIDDVRQALSDLAQRKGGGDAGKQSAYKVLKEAGDAERLPGSPADKALGGAAPGALKEVNFQAVIDAAKEVK